MIKKVLIGIVLLAIAGAGLWWSGLLNDYLPGRQAPAPAEQATTTPQQQAQPVSDLPTDTGDSSDAAVVQDSAAVDAQLQGLSSDESSADSSLNDKPTAQEF